MSSSGTRGNGMCCASRIPPGPGHKIMATTSIHLRARKLEGTALLVLHSRPGHARRDRDAYKRVVGPLQFERAELSQHYVDRGSRVVFAYTLAMLFSYQLNIDPTIKN